MARAPSLPDPAAGRFWPEELACTRSPQLEARRHLSAARRLLNAHCWLSVCDACSAGCPLLGVCSARGELLLAIPAKDYIDSVLRALRSNNVTAAQAWRCTLCCHVDRGLQLHPARRLLVHTTVRERVGGLPRGRKLSQELIRVHKATTVTASECVTRPFPLLAERSDPARNQLLSAAALRLQCPLLGLKSLPRFLVSPVRRF